MTQGLTLYRFTARGMALPAVVVVAARDEDAGRAMAREWLKAAGTPVGRFDLESATPLVVPGVVYGWDGDY